MMNRKILALAITAVVISGTANAAEIYNKDGNKINLTGSVEAEYRFRDKYTPVAPNTTAEKRHNDDKTKARLGFIGETQINTQLTGYAKFEQQFGVGNAEEDETRYAYVGLKFADYGSLDFGRNYGVVGLIRDFTDNAAMFGGSAFGGDKDIFLTDRASGVATYSNHDFFSMLEGLDFYLQYQAKDNKNHNGPVMGEALAEGHGDGFAIATTYHHADTGLGLGLTYSKSDRTEDQVESGKNGYSAGGKNAEIWGIAGKYDANNIYFAVSWAQSNNMQPVHGHVDGGIYEIANKAHGFEAVANYTFDFGLTPSIVYNQQRGRDLHVLSNEVNGQVNAYLVKYVGLGASYEFNKNVDVAVGYKINLLDKDAIYSQQAQLATDNQVEMRLTYKF